jgi:hypothetical protein
MIIKTKEDPEILSKLNLTKDVIICYKSYKEIEALKMSEIYNIDYDIFIKNVNAIKAVNVNNILQFEYSPKIKISTPINIKLELLSNINNMSLYCNWHKTTLCDTNSDLKFTIYKDIKLMYKHIDVRIFSKFNGNIIPIATDLATFEFTYRITDRSYLLENDIYIIQNSMIYDTFPDLAG